MGRESLFCHYWRLKKIFKFGLVALGLHCCTAFPLAVGSRGYTPAGGAQASHCGGSSCCRAQALGHLGISRCAVPGLWSAGLVSPQHMGFSRTRDQTCVSCFGRWILYHWATKEALYDCLLMKLVQTHFPQNFTGHFIVASFREAQCQLDLYFLT